jgi:putative phosphoribosyl transferase
MRTRRNEEWLRPVDSSRADGLHAVLCVPRGAYGLVAIARGIEAAKYPGLYHELAESLREQGLATCLIDLVGPAAIEAPSPKMSAADARRRLAQTIHFIRHHQTSAGLPLAMVGVDVSAAVVLQFAAQHPRLMDAVVSWCGRKLLPWSDARALRTPTLLLVPGKERRLVQMSNRLFTALECSSQLAVVRGASTAFDEPGAMVAAQLVASQWCQQHIEQALARPCRPRIDH